MITTETLDAIDQLVTILIFSIIMAHSVSQHKLTSGVLASFAYIAVQCFGLALEPLVTNFISDVNRTIGRFVYYFGLATVEIMAVYVLRHFHKKMQLQFSIACNFIAVILIVHALINILRVIDRQAGLDVMEHFYPRIIPALNISVVGILLFDYSITRKKWS